MDKLEEWENHVSKTGERGSIAYCGIKIEWSEFYLIDKEHAIGCVNQETRVQPCPRCYKEIVKNG